MFYFLWKALFLNGLPFRRCVTMVTRRTLVEKSSCLKLKLFKFESIKIQWLIKEIQKKTLKYLYTIEQWGISFLKFICQIALNYFYLSSFRRSISDISINSNTATSNDTDFDLSTRDYDTELEAMSKNFERIAMSVGEPTQSYFPGGANSKVWSKEWSWWRVQSKSSECGIGSKN